MSTCGSPNPETGVACQAPASFPNHDPHFSNLGGTPVEWPNPDYVPPPPRRSKKKSERIKDLADRAKGVRPERGSSDEVPVGVRHPDTSHLMANKIRPTAGTLLVEVLESIEHSGEHGRTDDEMEQLLGRAHQSVSGARNVLMKRELVVDSGRTRLTRYGHEAIVWVAETSS